jgi:xanthine dehydrogenase YagR molybdenum-binding subunit
MKDRGDPIDRVDGRLKVMGRAAYAAEVEVSGVVHAVMVTSGIARGRITRMDVARAQAGPRRAGRPHARKCAAAARAA